MQQIQIRRAKNLWVPLTGNFCIPYAVWELDLEQLESLTDIDVRKQTASFLVKPEGLHPRAPPTIKYLLALTAAKLQSCGSDDIFAWLMEASARCTDSRFCYPFLDEKVAAIVGPLAINCLSRINVAWTNRKKLDDAIAESLNLIVLYRHQIDSVGPSFNSARSLIEAASRSIPFRRHSDRISYQLGYGARRKLIYNGYTNHTSQIATNIATHKHLAASVMRQASIPAPEHFVVKTLDEAKFAAAKIKFPLVVKPTSTDKGVGVTVGVQNEDELDFAWRQASQFGNVLVEKMLRGFDHRFHIVNGKCVYVVRRLPPFVRGNGIDSIEHLMPAYKAEKAKNKMSRMDPDASLSDPAVIEFLNKQGLSATSVIKKDETVFLRSNSNASTGGVFEDVTSSTHPANIALAERASRIVGLDHAGVDYITTDVSKPWNESGGGICEINPTPGTFHDDAHRELLNYLFPKRATGHIPLILIIGNTEFLQSYVDLMIGLRKKYFSSFGFIYGKSLNISSARGSFESQGNSTQNLLTGLLSDELVESMFIQLGFEEMRSGLELHYVDLLVAMGTESDISVIRKSDLMNRCNQANILINPTIDRFQDAIDQLYGRTVSL